MNPFVEQGMRVYGARFAQRIILVGFFITIAIAIIFSMANKLAVMRLAKPSNIYVHTDLQLQPVKITKLSQKVDSNIVHDFVKEAVADLFDLDFMSYQDHLLKAMSKYLTPQVQQDFPRALRDSGLLAALKDGEVWTFKISTPIIVGKPYVLDGVARWKVTFTGAIRRESDGGVIEIPQPVSLEVVRVANVYYQRGLAIGQIIL